MVTPPPEECPRGVPQAGDPRHPTTWRCGAQMQDFSLLATEDEGAMDLYGGAV